MNQSTRFTARVAVIVALGGFLMGFDASVISGVVGFIEREFSLSKLQVGWSVACLTLTATFAMMVAGPLSDKIGRRPVLKIAAALYAISAVASAFAPGFVSLVVARMIGGLGVGAALIIAPMYIAEIAPARLRGRMVSINQLNIVIGISAAFFSNYLILKLSSSDFAWLLLSSDWTWRWMLGLEFLPAIIYLVALLFVPESPRWLAMHGKEDEAQQILLRASSADEARASIEQVHASLAKSHERVALAQLFQPAMKLVMAVGLSVAVLQQITGINAVFFYAPMIFEQSGIGTDASFMQAVMVGLVNLVFTVVAMALIDRVGRRPLLGFGLAGIAVCMLTLSYAFASATYTLEPGSLDTLPVQLERSSISTVVGITYNSDVEFRDALTEVIGKEAYQQFQSALVSAAINSNPTLILLAILGFVASFAVSLGPVMWVLFSELFPNRLRGLAISFAGLVNSAVSFTVQLVFPWELEQIGSASTFLIFALFAVMGLLIVLSIMPETRGRTLEELEKELIQEDN